MFYERKVDALVRKHLEQFQWELSVSKEMRRRPEPKKQSPMPYGYPIAVYRPLHRCGTPPVTRFILKRRRKLRNGVPWIIGMGIVGGYTLAAYNPNP